jgi:hypothetical protein
MGADPAPPPSALHPLFEPLHLHPLCGVPEAHIEVAEIGYVLVGDAAALALDGYESLLGPQAILSSHTVNSSTDSPASGVPKALRSFPSQHSRSCLCCISMNPSQLMHSMIVYSHVCVEKLSEKGYEQHSECGFGRPKEAKMGRKVPLRCSVRLHRRLI